MMTLHSTGKLEWPRHTIISKETRLWLGIDEESCKTATADLDQTVLGGIRTLTNLSAKEQWLSMHQCIDDKCPVHHDDKYSKPASRVNEENEFHIKEIENDSSKSQTNSKSLTENTKCRRQLFGDDNFSAGQTVSAMPKLGNVENEDQVPVKRPSNALHHIFMNYNRLDDLAPDSSPSNQESTTHKHVGNNLRLSKHNTNNLESSQTFEPRFICTWLNDHVSIDTYPLYKLSVLFACTDSFRREDFGLFSTSVTDNIWTSHKYLGDVDNEILECINTSNSSCIKTKSFECCSNETTANVLKDICDVDISDIKTKYNFLFDPTYIFQTTEIVKHAGVKRLGGRCNSVIQQYHGDSESNAVSESPADTYAHDYGNDTKSTNSLDYVGLTNNVQCIQTGIPPKIQSERQTMGHFPVHQQNYLNKNTTNLFSSLPDPRLNKTMNETNWMNGNPLCCHNYRVSPDMCNKINDNVMFANSKEDKRYGNNSDQSIYNMSPLPVQYVDALNPYPFTGQISNQDNREAVLYSSHLVNGNCFSPRNQMELPLTHDSDYSGSSEQGDYFSRVKQTRRYQSPLEETGYATTAIHPIDQQCLRSPMQFDERYTKGNHCDKPVSNSSGRSPYRDKRCKRSITSTSRCTSHDRIRSRRGRSYKTRRAKCDDDNCSTPTRHKQSGYRSCDEMSEEEYYEQQTEYFKSPKVNYEDNAGIFDPIPRYLMDIASQDFAKRNNYMKRTSSPHYTSTRSSYDEYWSSSRNKKGSENFRLGYSSRDRIPRDVSRSRTGQTYSLGKYLTAVGRPKFGYSEEYLGDRQRRLEHRCRRERKSTSPSRSRTRPRSGVARSPKPKISHSPNIISRSHSMQRNEHKECKSKLKFESSFSKNRSSARNMDRSTSVGQRRHGDLRARAFT